jgi:phage gp36-like protein
MAVTQTYSTIDSILKNISSDELILNVNDENRESAVIDLTDPADKCRIRVEEQIKAAAVECNGYIISRYTIPFAVVPDLLIEISDDITIFNLYKRRLKLDMPESLERNYKNRIAQLRDIQKSVINLGVAEQQESSGMASEARVNKTTDDRIFSSGLLTKF